jgi:EmrB/QacA subfamily drug resistance transporter
MTALHAPAPPSRPASAATAGRRWIALAVLCVSLLVVTLDNTVLNVVLPKLVTELQASSSDLQWIVDAYILVFAGLLLVAGSLADRIGRKRTFLAGLVAFAIGSTWAAFSGAVGMLIAARASMGIGAALIMPSTLSIITHTFTDKHERQRALGMWSATSGLGIALGPIVGGALLEHYWWGSVFLINVPIVVLGLIFAVPLVQDSKNPAARPPDVIGALLSIVGVGLLLWSIIEAPVHGWTSSVVLTAGAGGAVVLAGFTMWEARSSHPMLNLSFLRNRRFSVAVASVGLNMFGMAGSLFVFTQFLQFDLRFSPLQAGVRILPAAGAIALVAPLSTLVLRFVGPKVTLCAGLVAVSGGLWWVSSATVDTHYPGTVLGMALLGVGAGLVIPTATGIVMGSLPEEHTGVGAATNGMFLQFGGALGVAVVGSLLSTRYADRVSSAIAPYPVPHSVGETISGSLGGALGVAQRVGGATGEALAGAARSAFISGMDLGMATAGGVVATGAVLAFVAFPRTRRRQRSR